MRNRLGAVCLLILIGVGAYTLITTPSFRIKSITIEGCNFIPSEEIYTHVESLKGQHSLVVLRSYKHEKEIKAQYPAIDKIDISLQFPNKLQVQIIEKKEWVSYLTNQANKIIAKDGTILNQYTNAPQVSGLDQMIIIRGIKDDALQGNSIDRTLLQKTERIVSNIRYYFPYKNIQIEFIDNDHLILIKEDTLPIKLGKLEHIEDKFRNLMYFFRQYPEKENRLDYIDLRIKDRIVVKERNG
ncbi:FtsQ-type POTRA domain-containing protein [bacterium]|jgi:cell division septal protein FtsQ|nr:FtsQ-type POTRA domain-containing protein [bacterium]